MLFHLLSLIHLSGKSKAAPPTGLTHYLFPLLIPGGEEQDESKNRLRHKAEQIRIEPPHINHLPLRGNTTKVAKGAEHLQKSSHGAGIKSGRTSGLDSRAAHLSTAFSLVAMSGRVALF